MNQDKTIEQAALSRELPGARKLKALDVSSGCIRSPGFRLSARLPFGRLHADFRWLALTDFALDYLGPAMPFNDFAGAASYSK